jgi:hypothetical protein
MDGILTSKPRTVLSAKAKGAYFVKITQGDDSVIKKIIVE